MAQDQILENASYVGRYRIEEVLGVGSHAVVYKAFDTILNRVVALKILKPEVAADKEMFARFEREARAAANLMHPHIAWVWDIGQADGKHFLAVKYVEGVTLDELIAQEGKVSWNEALKIIEEISSALDFAHNKGVIHRDIKPKNIMVSPQDGAVLTDFGLAKVLYDSAVKTSVGMILGSPGYIPPEIWLGDPATPATDQYALACVFYEMLCGKPLFGAGGNFNMIIREHLEGLPLRSLLPYEIPADANQPLRKALSRNPSDRYEKLADFIKDLKGVDLQVEKDTGDLREKQPPEGVADEQKPVDMNITPSTGIPSQEVTRVHLTQSAKSDWKSRFRSLISSERPKFMLASITPPGKIYRLDRDEYTLGRDAQCDIFLEGMGISRRHAALMRTKDGFSIKDLNSKNGTFVNGERITEIKPLAPGDVIDLGTSARLIFKRE